jgi:hypothetical protein
MSSGVAALVEGKGALGEGDPPRLSPGLGRALRAGTARNPRDGEPRTPDRWNILGAAICLGGAALILFAPRNA